MIGNLIILAITVAITWFSVNVFTTEKRNVFEYKYSAIVLILFMVFSIIIPNINWIRSPLTLQISGKIIDVETIKPISNAVIVANYMQKTSEFPYHSYISSYNHSLIKSDLDGNFFIKSNIKNLSIIVFPLYSRHKDMSSAVVMFDAYKIKYLDQNNTRQTIALEKPLTTRDIIDEQKELNNIKGNASQLYKGKSYEYVSSYISNRLIELRLRGNDK